MVRDAPLRGRPGQRFTRPCRSRWRSRAFRQRRNRARESARRSRLARGCVVRNPLAAGAGCRRGVPIFTHSPATRGCGPPHDRGPRCTGSRGCRTRIRPDALASRRGDSVIRPKNRGAGRFRGISWRRAPEAKSLAAVAGREAGGARLLDCHRPCVARTRSPRDARGMYPVMRKGTAFAIPFQSKPEPDWDRPRTQGHEVARPRRLSAAPARPASSANSANRVHSIPVKGRNSSSVKGRNGSTVTRTVQSSS